MALQLICGRLKEAVKKLKPPWIPIYNRWWKDREFELNYKNSKAGCLSDQEDRGDLAFRIEAAVPGETNWMSEYFIEFIIEYGLLRLAKY